ncbi:polysaccharide deacetylase family protein [Clostridium sp. D33t1_170424_F3]|uniref:polysaccharide deacetylase family protein n=1 Tax=Clostridium sp. D33t1_170424_F3 TaxID=2787099 RepID=UPI0025707295|nr:polysaccharide deacetylase family protein [Clostridium sp. D33t1_170424_F3]
MKRAKYVRKNKRRLRTTATAFAVLALFAVFSGTCLGLSKSIENTEVVGVSQSVQNMLHAAAVPTQKLPDLTILPERNPSSTPEEKPLEPEAPPAQQYDVLPNDPYPLLYAAKVEQEKVDPKDRVAYLTFDDGPSSLTIPLLDVLDQYNVKATFFVVGKTDEESLNAMKEIVKRGHTIAVHTYTHDYKKIYTSVDAYLEDFAKIHKLIKDTTGVNTALYRFAGGSINSYNKQTAKAIIAEMSRRGYVYFDWNVDSGDATRNNTESQIYSHAVNDSKRFSRPVILCHNTDAKKATLNQMPKIIEALQKSGYRFDVLRPETKPVVFHIPED